VSTAAVDDMAGNLRLGLRANWRQFTLLVVVNAFVGAMVGIERTVLPLLAEGDFEIASASATLAFLVAFGITKAVANLAAGHLADRYGRKRVLVLGWMAALPVAPMIIWAP
jgi:MFS family permease